MTTMILNERQAPVYIRRNEETNVEQKKAISNRKEKRETQRMYSDAEYKNSYASYPDTMMDNS